jgi:phage terminase large subunit
MLTALEEREYLTLLEFEESERTWVDNANEVYRPYFDNHDRYNLFYGSAGSGKSVFIAQRIVRRLDTEPGHNYLALRGFSVTNRLSTFPLIKQIISERGLEDRFEINKSEMTITHKINKNQIVFAGLDDAERLKSITFQNGPLTDAWIEEATEISESDFITVDLRLRGLAKRPFQLTISFNPISVFHWIKAYFFDTKRDSCSILKTTYKHNRFLDEQYKRTLEGLKEEAHRVYALGEWGQLEGLIFKKFDIKEIPEGAKLLGYGLDFGYSSDPAALIEIWMHRNEPYFKEVVYKTELTNQDLMHEMEEANISKLDEIIADSAEPKSIEEIYREGWNIWPAVKGPDSINAGINKMKEYRMLHITPESVNLQKEFYAYSWKKNKEGQGLPVPVDAFNHGIDACRMFLNRPAIKSPFSQKSIARATKGGKPVLFKPEEQTKRDEQIKRPRLKI